MARHRTMSRATSVELSRSEDLVDRDWLILAFDDHRFPRRNVERVADNAKCAFADENAVGLFSRERFDARADVDSVADRRVLDAIFRAYIADDHLACID